MAQQENVTILNVETKQAVKSISELRENIKYYKKIMEEAEQGSRQFQLASKHLQENQNALKDAMYNTTQSMSEITASAKGATESYNGLVHRMADLKKELRATDVSTEEGMKHFKDLASQVNEVNDKLKAMDELQGNFQRNVGNYPNLAKTWSNAFDQLDKGLKASAKGVGGLKDGFDSLAKNPIMFLVGVLVTAFLDLKTSMKDNEQVMGSIQKAGMSLEPILNLIKAVVQKLAEWISVIIEKAGEFLGSNGIIDQIINGVVGVGNAILKFIIAPFKGIASAIEVFKEQGVSGLKDAVKAFANEMKNGVSFKANYDAGASIVDGITAGMVSKKEEAQEVGKEIAQEVNKGFELAIFDEDEIDVDAIAEKYYKILEKARKKREEEMALWTEENDALTAEIDAMFDEIWAKDEEDKKHSEEMKNARVNSLFAVANATSSVLDTLASLYEQDSENNEKNAEKAKALRIASATIDTISGAVGAFMQASATIPPPYGQIVGAIQSAVVTATGIAQIAQMKSTSMSASGGRAATPTPAVVSAPTSSVDIPQVRNLTSATEEDRLNQMAGDQRVKLVMSDLEVKQGDIRVQTAETTF